MMVLFLWQTWPISAKNDPEINFQLWFEVIICALVALVIFVFGVLRHCNIDVLALFGIKVRHRIKKLRQLRRRHFDKLI